jgi:hypothetical protein
MQSSQYEKLFNENVVMTMEQLKLATGQPRESILRDLRGVGYYSSYNERGKYYTLDGTPIFDNCGLWRFHGAYFSIRRTLLDTAEYLICASSAGYTHDELRQILGIGIHNSLYQLTTVGRITRRQVGGQYVYFGIEDFSNQAEKRSAMPVVPLARKAVKTSGSRSYSDIDPALVIDILVAVLRGHETDSAAYSYLRQTGSPATAQQVAAVFHYYDIGKKNSPAQN